MIAADPRLLARYSGGRWAVAPGAYRLTLGLDADRAIASDMVRVGAPPSPVPIARK